MAIFGWRLTKKSPVQEKKEMKDLLRLLKKQEVERMDAEKKAKKEAERLRAELAKAKQEEAKRKGEAKKLKMLSARKHLEVAERYEEMQFSHKEGTARHAELEAIKLKRLEAAENLGVKVTSTISKTIALIK